MADNVCSLRGKKKNCPVQDNLFLHDNKPFKNNQFLLKFYDYILWQLLLITYTLLILN